uniref:MARVEL domain-containing protein n=1 Tax=Ciona savignyi TaxID=51511 RepID=H2YUI2_CIOSA
MNVVLFLAISKVWLLVLDFGGLIAVACLNPALKVLLITVDCVASALYVVLMAAATDGTLAVKVSEASGCATITSKVIQHQLDLTTHLKLMNGDQ